MPLTEADQRRVDEVEAEAKAAGPSRLIVRAAEESQKIGSITVACLILNRTIGSGIFVAPALVLRATNSIGVSLLLWTLGAVFGFCGLLVWLEHGLSIPKFRPSDHSLEPHIDGEGPLESVPRNGGEKNYLEYIYNQPKFQTTCIYGFVFITLGNLAGNALAFGIYVIRAAGLQDNHSAHHHAVRAVAVAALTVSCLLHGSWRKGGIMVNNTLAFIKVTILLAIVGIGFASAAGASLGAGPTGKAAREQNMSVHNSFDDAHRNIGDYVGSILLAAYSFDGFQQPFNMLAEVAEPRKKFAKTTVGTMLLLTILYILVNVAFFCAIPQQVIVNDYPDLDMATIFFQELFGSKIAARVISGMIAVSILGNLVVMTLTASRVKQEIAKEGILPFSLFFANDTVTPYARLRAWLSPQKKTDELPERSPAAALSLHLALSLILVGATSSREPIVAYTILVELYEYTLVLMVGLAVAAGIVFLRWHRRQEWMESLGFHTWGGPTAAIIYATICAFLMVTLFLTPSDRSYRSSRVTKVQPYVVPTIGLCTLLMGYAYYLVFAKLIPRLKKKNLVVERDPIIVRQGGKPDGEWVVGVEVVEFWWAAKEPALAKEA